MLKSSALILFNWSIYLFVLTNSTHLIFKKSFNQYSPPGMERKSSFAKLPDSLGGDMAHGFAVVKATYNRNLGLTQIELMKLQLTGSRTINYFYPNKLSKTTLKYLPFLKDYTVRQKIIKYRKTKTESEQNSLTFMIRFLAPSK